MDIKRVIKLLDYNFETPNFAFEIAKYYSDTFLK